MLNRGNTVYNYYNLSSRWEFTRFFLLFQAVSGTTISSPMNTPTLLDDDLSDQDLPVSTKHQIKYLQQQMEHQQQQTQVAIAQVHLLKDQLAAETAARIESQVLRLKMLVLQPRSIFMCAYYVCLAERVLNKPFQYMFIWKT